MLKLLSCIKCLKIILLLKLLQHLPGANEFVHIGGDVLITPTILNTLRPRPNGHHFPGDNLKWIFFNENIWILMMKFVVEDSLYNQDPWCLSSCITGLQLVNQSSPSAAYMRQWTGSALVQIIGFRSGFSRREISSVYLWCWWQWTKIERRNSMRKIWLKT